MVRIEAWQANGKPKSLPVSCAPRVSKIKTLKTVCKDASLTWEEQVLLLRELALEWHVSTHAAARATVGVQGVRCMSKSRRYKSRRNVQAKATSSDDPIAMLDKGFSLKRALNDSGSKLGLLKYMTSAQLTKHVATGMAQHISRQIYEGLHDDEEADAGGIETEAPESRKTQKKTTRLKFRQTIDEVIGPEPSTPLEWKTQDNWVAMMEEMTTRDYNESYSQHVAKYPQFSSPESFIASKTKDGSLGRTMGAGYEREEAEALCCVNSNGIKAVLAQAAEEQSHRYASLTHAIYNALAQKAATGEVAPRCFVNLTGIASLSATDRRWADITTPDTTGFRGLTSYGTIKFFAAEPKGYDPKGLRRKVGGKWQVIEATAVCVESAAMNGKVLHSAVRKTQNGFLLPPLTLLEVIDEQDCFEYLPGKWIQQKLVIVRPTFLLPAKKLEDNAFSNTSSKFAGDRSFLQYGGTNDAVRGLAEITDDAPLTMKQEWARDDKW